MTGQDFIAWCAARFPNRNAAAEALGMTVRSVQSARKDGPGSEMRLKIRLIEAEEVLQKETAP